METHGPVKCFGYTWRLFQAFVSQDMDQPHQLFRKLLLYVRQVLVLDQGRVVEQGTFIDLMARQDGFLARLLAGKGPLE